MRLTLAMLATAVALPGCNGCSNGEPAKPVASAGTTITEAPVPLGGAAVVAESLPRCRIDGARLAVPGEDAVVGEAVLAPDALLVGVVRREGTRRLASVVRASLDLSNVRVVE